MANFLAASILIFLIIVESDMPCTCTYFNIDEDSISIRRARMVNMSTISRAGGLNLPLLDSPEVRFVESQILRWFDRSFLSLRTKKLRARLLRSYGPLEERCRNNACYFSRLQDDQYWISRLIFIAACTQQETCKGFTPY